MFKRPVYEYFEDINKGYFKSILFKDKDCIILDCQKQIEVAEGAFKPGNPFVYGTGYMPEVNGEIKDRCFWVLYRIYYETLYNDLKNGDIDETYLLDYYGFIENELTGIPATEKDLQKMKDIQFLSDYGKKGGLRVYTGICCGETISMVESMKYLKPEKNDIDVLINFCFNMHLVLGSIEDCKKTIDKLINTGLKITSSETKDKFLNEAIRNIEKRLIECNDIPSIPAPVLVRNYYNSKLIEVEPNSVTEVPPPILKQKASLSIDRIALKHVYEGILITRANGNAIAKVFGHTSGEKLFQRFIFYSSAANRKGKPIPCTPTRLKNKIKLLESVAAILPEDKQAKAKDEIYILKQIMDAEYQ